MVEKNISSYLCAPCVPLRREIGHPHNRIFYHKQDHPSKARSEKSWKNDIILPTPGFGIKAELILLILFILSSFAPPRGFRINAKLVAPRERCHTGTPQCPSRAGSNPCRLLRPGHAKAGPPRPLSPWLKGSHKKDYVYLTDFPPSVQLPLILPLGFARQAFRRRQNGNFRKLLDDSFVQCRRVAPFRLRARPKQSAPKIAVHGAVELRGFHDPPRLWRVHVGNGQ